MFSNYVSVYSLFSIIVIAARCCINGYLFLLLFANYGNNLTDSAMKEKVIVTSIISFTGTDYGSCTLFVQDFSLS